MNKKIFMVAGALVMGGFLWASDFGSAAVNSGEKYSLEEMFRYALEDEHMALAEYNALMDKYGLTRPYANIAESEKTHIAYLETLYKNYGFQIPEVDTESHLILPGSVQEAYQTGVEAEIKNIAMYDTFLNQELPNDVSETFIFLKRASENHLRAFERQVARY